MPSNPIDKERDMPANRTRKAKGKKPRSAAAEQQVREEMLDKTLADSYPASDPPSSIPNPSYDSFVEDAEGGEEEPAA